jgi:hypothetical protein
MDDIRLLTEDPAALSALARVEVLYTDLDGTLLAPGGCILADAEGAPSNRVTEAIIDLNRAGLAVVPISGRGRAQLTELVRLLGWRDFIAEAGAIIVHGVGSDTRVRYNNGEWPEGLGDGGLTPYEIIEQTGAAELLGAAFPGRLEYHTPWHLSRESTHLLRGCLDLGEARERLAGLQPPVGLLDNGIVRNAGTLACDEESLPHAYHLVPKGVSKAQAIALDLRMRGLKPEQAAAIGDSATDIEMADSVAVMALVDNAFASPSVRAELTDNPRANVGKTCCRRGDGWVEFARAWLTAREAAPRG